MNQPIFAVGDRIRNKSNPVSEGVVTELTSKGFKYKLDNMVIISPRIGWYQEGECYFNGYHTWEKIEGNYQI